MMIQKFTPKITISAAVACSKIIQEVEALANAGEIENAIRLCQKSLQLNGAQTDLLYMLAILHQTAGDFVASKNYLKKLFTWNHDTKGLSFPSHLLPSDGVT